MSRWLCKDYLKGTCINSFCEKWNPPECLFYKSENGCRLGETCSYAHRQVDEQPSKSFFYKMVTNVQWLCRKLHENWVAYFNIWSRDVYNDFAEELKHTEANPMFFDSLKPCYFMLTFETRIRRLE